MHTTNETRRSVMTVAWSLFREAAKVGQSRTFSDALSGAWRWVKRLHAVRPAWMRGKGGPRTVVLRSPIAPSAIARRHGATAFAGGRSSHAYQAACMGR